MWVRFQPKAWYDEGTCLAYGRERLPEVTKEARRNGRESGLIADNLFGQTTKEFIRTVKSRAKMVTHLLPGGVTDLLQLIDAGFGALVKKFLGQFFDEWTLEGDNLEQWRVGLQMWQKRVLITHLLEKAYAKACENYDFERNAIKLGNLMTIDGSDDDQIKLQGVESYAFAEEDGGSHGGSSADEADDGGEIGPDDDEDDLYVESSDDEEDDTDELDAAAALNLAQQSAVAPEGFVVITTPPPEELNALIGKPVLYQFSGAPLAREDFGWYLGWVANACSPQDKKKHPGVTYDVWFCSDETNGVLPAAYVKGTGARGDKKDKAERISIGLTRETWGVDQKWVALTPPKGKEQCPHGTKPPAKKKGKGRKK